MDIWGLRAGTVDCVLVAVLIMVLPSINLTAGNQPLLVPLPTGDGALRERKSSVTALSHIQITAG